VINLTVRLPSTRIQPIAAADVVNAVVEVSTGAPLQGIRKRPGNRGVDGSRGARLERMLARPA
jgi:hypothetical protein